MSTLLLEVTYNDVPEEKVKKSLADALASLRTYNSQGRLEIDIGWEYKETTNATS